ncbi:unnamed protein product [Trichogramma brassicae]|uniref:Odorant receptor n=1 Tax=Trichogramma brassicae TaxID=86971 RepID=A0A6H5J662_9HYME|nr:unnamed protein product [Trichogramma brassicae]
MATFYEQMRNCLSINFRIVALMGCRLRGAAPTTTTAAAAAPSLADKLPMFYVIFTETLALLGQINFVAARWSREPDLAMQCIGHALNNTLCISKGFLLLLNTGRLRGLLDELLRNWRRYRPTHAEDRARIARRAEKSLMLSKVLMVSTLSCIVGFGLPPLL